MPNMNRILSGSGLAYALTKITGVEIAAGQESAGAAKARLAA